MNDEVTEGPEEVTTEPTKVIKKWTLLVLHQYFYRQLRLEERKGRRLKKHLLMWTGRGYANDAILNVVIIGKMN